MQEPLQPSGFRPPPALASPAMSFHGGPLWERLLDRIDLLVDFATLGEYGLQWQYEREALRGPERPKAALEDGLR